ncbi:MAG: hypothetical protein R3F19_06600 [Verrucomicrobiales bacterium]
MMIVRVASVAALVLLGFLCGRMLVPAASIQPLAADGDGTASRVIWHVPEGRVTVRDTLLWSEELSRHEFQLKLGEALETMPISSLRQLAREHREIGYTEYLQEGYQQVHDALIRRAPWLAVQDLVENAEWERANMGNSDDDLDLESMISRTLVKLYRDEPARVLDVYRHLINPLLIRCGIHLGFKGEALLAVVEATAQSEAGKNPESLGFLLEAYGNGFSKWASKDSAAALEKARAIEDPKYRSAALIATIDKIDDPTPLARELWNSGQLETRDIRRWLPDEALEWARGQSSDDPVVLEILRSEVLRSIKAGDEETARQLAEQHFTLTEIKSIWMESERDIPKDLNWLKSQQRISGYTVRQWSEFEARSGSIDFSAVRHLFEHLPPDREGKEAVAAFASRWAEQPGQEQAAADWAENLPQAATRHTLIKFLVQSWARKEPMAAATWSLQLEPVELRKTAMAGSLPKLARIDADSAISILQRARLPEEFRAAMAQQIERAQQ